MTAYTTRANVVSAAVAFINDTAAAKAATEGKASATNVLGHTLFRAFVSGGDTAAAAAALGTKDGYKDETHTLTHNGIRGIVNKARPVAEWFMHNPGAVLDVTVGKGKDKVTTAYTLESLATLPLDNAPSFTSAVYGAWSEKTKADRDAAAEAKATAEAAAALMAEGKYSDFMAAYAAAAGRAKEEAAAKAREEAAAKVGEGFSALAEAAAAGDDLALSLMADLRRDMGKLFQAAAKANADHKATAKDSAESEAAALLAAAG